MISDIESKRLAGDIQKTNVLFEGYSLLTLAGAGAFVAGLFTFNQALAPHPRIDSWAALWLAVTAVGGIIAALSFKAALNTINMSNLRS
jgi:hypothetical protein